MFTRFFTYATTMRHMIHADLLMFKQVYPNKLIDYLIYISITTLVTSYLLPTLGTSAKLGLFTLATTAGVSGLLETYPQVASMISDLDGKRAITFDIGLPMPSWMVFLKMMLTCSIQNMLMGIFILPIGLICIPQQFDASVFSLGKFALIFTLSSLFFGAFAVYLSTFIRTMHNIDFLWTRMLFPLWFLGGYQFSWYTLLSMNKPLAYATLANPFLFIMEGTRAAILGQTGSLPFWLCVLVTAAFTLLFGTLGIRSMHKRLDCV
jgi:ABC-2 type transport system permease protein